MKHARLTCVIEGRVHGVGFRYGIQALAQRLRLVGRVRNTDDGCVEVIAEGSTAALETLRTFCYRGPDGATITGVRIVEGPATGEFSTFEIR